MGAEAEPTDVVASTIGRLPSREHQQTLRAVVEAVLVGPRAGICVTGERGTGRMRLVHSLATLLPAGRVRIASLDGVMPSPADLARVVTDFEADRTGGTRCLLVVPEADALRRDTLARLDELAGTLRDRPRHLQLLVTAEPIFLTRLQFTRCFHLQAYLSTQLTLPLLSEEEAGAYLLACMAGAQPPVLLAHEQQSAILRSSRGNPYRLRHAVAAPPGSWSPPKENEAEDEAPKPARPRTLALTLASAAVIVGAASGIALTWRGSETPTVVTTTATLDLPMAARREPMPEPRAVVPDNAPETPVGLPDAPGPGEPPANTAAPDPAPAGPVEAPARPGMAEAGLIIIARSGDSLPQLYRRIYAGLEPPSFEIVAAVNPRPIRAGSRVMFPRPPGGWDRAAGRPDDGSDSPGRLSLGADQ